MKKIEMHGMTICPEPIAKGIYEGFTEEERTILKMGMLPARKMELLNKHLALKFAKEHQKEAELIGRKFGGIIKAAPLCEKQQAAFVRDAARAITLEIYALGNLVV